MARMIGAGAWGLRELALPEQLQLAAALQLQLLELGIAGTSNDFLQLDSVPAAVRQARDWFKQYGILPDCCCTGNNFTGDDVAEEVARVKRAIEIAAGVGGRYLRIFAGFASDRDLTRERFRRMLGALREVAGYGAQLGVLVLVETHGGVAGPGAPLPYFATASTRFDTWEELLDTGVKILYDPANLAAVGVEPLGFFRRFAEHIRVVHWKDFRRIPDGGLEPIAAGDGGGLLDVPALLEMLCGFDGPLLIEYELPADVGDGLRRSLEYLHR